MTSLVFVIGLGVGAIGALLLVWAKEDLDGR